MIGDIWYRYTDTQYAAPLDENEHPMGLGDVAVSLQEYRVIKETPKGVWVQYGNSLFKEKRFVLRTARKRFAYPTKELAKESFIARKEAQIRINKDQIRRAEQALLYLERRKI
jgi:hypothetical protein